MEDKDLKRIHKDVKRRNRLKIRYFIICMLGRNRVKWLKKHRVFAELGNDVLFQPTKLPNDCELIKIHNNVKVAAEVTFYAHDVINSMFEKMDNCKYRGYSDCIEIFDNVFIGARSIILPGVKIGPNAIVGGGVSLQKTFLPALS